MRTCFFLYIFFFSFSLNSQNWKIKPSTPQENVRFSSLSQISPIQTGFIAWHTSQKALGNFDYYFEAFNHQMQFKKAWKFQSAQKQEPEFVWKTKDKDWLFLSSVQGKKKILSAGNFVALKAEVTDIQNITERRIIDRNPFSFADVPGMLNPYFFHFRLNSDSSKLLIAFCHPELESGTQKWSYIILNPQLQIISERMIALPFPESQSLFCQIILTDMDEVIGLHLAFEKASDIVEKKFKPSFSFFPLSKTQSESETVFIPSNFQWADMQTYQWQLNLVKGEPFFAATGNWKKERQCLLFANRESGNWMTTVYKIPDSLEINHLQEKQSAHLQVQTGSKTWVSWDLCDEKKGLHSNIVVVGLESNVVKSCQKVVKNQTHDSNGQFSGFISFLVQDTLQLIWNDLQASIKKPGQPVWTSEFNETDTWIIASISSDISRKRLYSGKEWHLDTSAGFLSPNFQLFYAASRNQHKFFKYAPEITEE